MSKRRVVLTGASGTIAGLMLRDLSERYDLVPLDIRSRNRDGEEVAGVQIADLLDRDRAAYRRHFEGADAVIHCGFVVPEDRNDPDARFWSEHANVAMAYNVYQTCWETGVRRLVVTSSNHAADYYEGLILAKQWDVVRSDMPARSDGYYGWAKDAYEHLGFVFAVGEMNGKPLANVQIRIGGPRETDVERCPRGDLIRLRRALAVYISQRDLLQLYVRSIEAESIADEHGVPFQIFYGISDNPHAFWSLASARRIIGYEPQDNSELRFRAEIAEHLRVAAAADPDTG